MAKLDMLLIGGHAYRWQEICELRRRQLEAWKAAQHRLSSRTIAVRRPNGPPPAATPSRPFSGGVITLTAHDEKV